MYDELKKVIISNNWKIPGNIVKNWYASTGNSGIVETYRYGKIYFYIIKPWAYCPNGNITIEQG